MFAEHDTVPIDLNKPVLPENSSDEILSVGMASNEQFHVAVMVEKLPSRWKVFKNILRHKTEELSLESIITQLRVE